MPNDRNPRPLPGTPGPLRRMYESAVNKFAHGTWETEAKYHERIQRVAPSFMGSGFYRFESGIKAKLLGIRTSTSPGNSPAPASAPTGILKIAVKRSVSKPETGKNPTSEHLALLGDQTSGRIWIASNPYPGDDAGKHVDDGRGTNLGQCVSLGKNRCPGLPPTREWGVGAKVQGRTDLPVGTLIIAPVNGRDWSLRGHMAIYNGQSAEKGLEITDQYVTGKGQYITRRWLPWDGSGSNPTIQSQGKRYYILVSK